MKIKSKFIASFLFAFSAFISFLNAQSMSPFALMQDTSLSYQEIVQRANPILDSMRLANGGTPTHDEKVFRRWQEFWKGRTNIANGRIGGDIQSTIDLYLQQAQGQYTICNQGPSGSTWSLVGPTEINSFIANNGIVTAIARHPTDTMVIYAGCNFSGVWKTTDGGANWRCVTDNLRLPLLPVHALVLDPDDPNTIYAGTGRTEHMWTRFGLGIFKSTDAGNSWIHTGPGIYGATVPAEVDVIRFHPINHNIMIAAGQKQIHRSTDRGATWTVVFGGNGNGAVTGGDEFVDLEVCQSNPSVWLASTREWAGDSVGRSVFRAELYRSTDMGLTWQCVNCQNPAPLPWEHTDRLMISATSPDGYLYIVHTVVVPGANLQINILKTNDGINFLQVQRPSIGGGGPGYHKFVFDVSPLDANKMYLGGTYWFHKLSAAGTFTPTAAETHTHEDFRDLLVWDGGNSKDRILVGTDGGISASKDSGVKWYKKNGRGLSIAQYYGFDLNPVSGTIVAGGQDVGTWRNIGPNWIEVYDNEDGGWVEIDDHNENVTVFGGLNSWRNNIDGFTTNILFANQMGIPGAYNGDLMDRRAIIDPLIPGKFWSGDAFHIKTIQADMLNATWSAPVWTRVGGNKDQTLSDLAISPLNPKVMYWSYAQPCWSDAATHDVLFRSMDGCSTAIDLTANLRPNPNSAALIYKYKFVTDLEVDPHDPGHVLAGISGFEWNQSLQQAIERVFESTDYGNTWTDISNGLPPFPVNHLLYQNGGGGVAYAATDGGVYRFNPTTRIWECFNAGLPAARCSRVVIDYCRGKILVGTFGRGIWEAPLPSVPDHRVTSTQTWETGSINHFANNVVVNSGVTLTIKGKVFFAKDKKLIVNYGGKVILQGGTLTSACDDMWGGVDVRGISSLPQTINQQGYAPNHGILQILAGGTIEHARVGVTTAFHDVLGNYYWNSFGGIVQCQNAKFLNNKIDVIMMPYSLTNRSYFRSCVFETNRLLKQNEKPVVHLSMWGVRNIPIEGCTFRYAAGNAYIPAQRGNGISGRDATYLVDWRCTAPAPGGCNAGTPTVFEDLVYGIDHVCTNRLLSPSVRRSHFTRNILVGLKLQNADYALIEDNVFDVGTGIPNMALGTGIYADHSSKYSMQSNQFKTTVSGAYGVIVNEGGDDENLVFNNTFTDLKYAISAQGDNEGPDDKDGLRMNCNDFHGGQYGIVVSGYGVGDAQGWNTQDINTQRLGLVRNRYYFSCDGSGVGENKFYIQLPPSTTTINHTTNPNQECLPIPQPNCSDLAVYVATLPLPLNKSEDCKREPAPTPPIIQTQRTMAGNELLNAAATYRQMIDGGNTANLLTNLATKTTSSDISTLLMNYSPYLSDEVLLAFIGQKSVVIPSDYKTVLVANSPLSSTILSKVPSLDLPSPVKEAIMAAQAGISARESARGNVYHWESEVRYWQEAELRHYLRDTLDSLAYQKALSIINRDALGACATAYGKGLLEPWGLDDNLLHTVHGCGISDAELERIAVELRSSAKACATLDQTLGDTTHEAKYTSLPIQYQTAQLLVEKYLGYALREVQFEPPQESKKTQTEGENAGSHIPEGLSIYPNPTLGEVSVLITTESKDDYRIRLIDLQGRLLLQSALVAGTPSRVILPYAFRGIAIYQVLKNGVHWKSGTLIVHSY